MSLKDVDKHTPEVIIRSQFKFYDKDNSGCIDKSELQELLLDMGRPCKKEECDALAMLLDKDGSGSIAYKEFAEWAKSDTKFQKIDLAQHYNMKNAIAMFKKYDTNRSGYLTRDEYAAMMADMKVHYSAEQLEKAMKALDKNNDNKIEFEEFCMHVHTYPRRISSPHRMHICRSAGTSLPPPPPPSLLLPLY